MIPDYLKKHLTTHPNEDFTYQQLGELVGRSSTYAGELVNKLASQLPASEGQIIKHRPSGGAAMLVRFEPPSAPQALPERKPRWR